MVSQDTSAPQLIFFLWRKWLCLTALGSKACSFQPLHFGVKDRSELGKAHVSKMSSWFPCWRRCLIIPQIMWCTVSGGYGCLFIFLTSSTKQDSQCCSCSLVIEVMSSVCSSSVALCLFHSLNIWMHHSSVLPCTFRNCSQFSLLGVFFGCWLCEMGWLVGCRLHKTGWLISLSRWDHYRWS